MLYNKPTAPYFQKPLSEKEISFYQQLKGDQHFNFILFPETINKGIGSFRFLEKGNLLGKEKQYYVAAMKAIAGFHHYSKQIQLEFLPQNQRYYVDAFQAVNRYAHQQHIVLPHNRMQELEESLDEIGSIKEVIHDDFLPQNVMLEGETVKIIDWADLRYGFAEHDVGRMLGDIDSKNPTYEHKYYPYEWHDELREIYLLERQQLDPKYQLLVGRKRVRWGELWNYLGPIEMSLKRGMTTDLWWQANLEGLRNL